MTAPQGPAPTPSGDPSSPAAPAPAAESSAPTGQPPAEGETAPASPASTPPADMVPRSELEAMQGQYQSLVERVATRYDAPAQPAGEGAPQPTGQQAPDLGDADLQAFGESYGMAKEDLDRFVSGVQKRVSANMQNGLSHAVSSLVSQTVAQARLTDRFYAKHADLVGMEEVVNPIYREFMGDPMKHRGRQAGECLDDIANLAYERLRWQRNGAGQPQPGEGVPPSPASPSIESQGNVQQTHAAPGGTAGGAAGTAVARATPDAPEPTAAEEWVTGIVQDQSRSMLGGGPLTGVKTS